VGTLIFMRNVPNKPRNRVLTEPLKYVRYGGGVGLIPSGFEWDGSSVPWIFQGFFPRHWHPIASCRHDWRCKKAMTPEERLFADKEFERDVGTTSWWITKKVGYLGVRIGAFFGVGVYNY
jgi:hypothetical protein